jgi:hypothetical protein
MLGQTVLGGQRVRRGGQRAAALLIVGEGHLQAARPADLRPQSDRLHGIREQRRHLAGPRPAQIQAHGTAGAADDAAVHEALAERARAEPSASG